jgi:hypothetical protein
MHLPYAGVCVQKPSPAPGLGRVTTAVDLNMGNYVSAPVAHADAGSLMPAAAAAAAAEPNPTKVRDRESLGMPADASETRTDRLRRRTLAEAGRSSARRAPLGLRGFVLGSSGAATLAAVDRLVRAQ